MDVIFVIIKMAEESLREYKNDLKEGIWRFYLPNSEVDYELEYENGNY